MQAHHKGHYAHVTEYPNPTTMRSGSALNEGREGHLKLLRCDDREFNAKADAARAGFEFAVRWINDGKPETFTFTTEWR